MSQGISKSKHDSATVSLAAPHAHEVYVAGSFNKWDPKATPMARVGSGPWTARLDLPAGRHEYKFLVDGEWCCDVQCEHAYSSCPKCTTNAFGTMNRVLTVQ